jgi:hypothetical protein
MLSNTSTIIVKALMSPTLTSSRKSDSLHATGLVALMEVPSSTGLRKQAVHNTPERASQERGRETAKFGCQHREGMELGL